MNQLKDKFGNYHSFWNTDQIVKEPLILYSDENNGAIHTVSSNFISTHGVQPKLNLLTSSGITKSESIVDLYNNLSISATKQSSSLNFLTSPQISNLDSTSLVNTERCPNFSPNCILYTYREPESISNIDESCDDNSVFTEDEDRQDIQKVLRTLLKFESLIDIPKVKPEFNDPYSTSTSMNNFNIYGNLRDKSIARENNRLSEQLKKVKSSVRCENSPQSDNIYRISGSRAKLLKKHTKHQRIELENLALLKRIQSAKPSKDISMNEQNHHFSKHQIYSKVASKNGREVKGKVKHSKSSTSLIRPEWVS